MAWIVFEHIPRPIPCEIHTTTTIGRHPTCDVQILDKGASKFHCRIHARGDEFWLEDLRSLNGTLVNGLRLKGEMRLTFGDRIQIGSAKGTFQETRESTAPPPEAESGADDPIQSPVENGQLTVERGGDLQVRLWNVAVGVGGFLVRIPLDGDRPPSSRLLTYPGKSSREELCLENGDAAFDALLEEARREGGSLRERERVGYLAGLVYRALGGRQTPAVQEKCLEACRPYTGRRMPIGALIRIGAGVCRHRAFLFFHLARKLGLRVEMFRGAVPDGRHAWNEVRIGAERVFVDASLGVVMDGAQEAEQALGYAASRFNVPHPTGDAEANRVLVVGDGIGEHISLPTFRHELRKVPGDEEAVLLLYPESELPEVRFLHVHLRAGPEGASMFALPPFISARVFAIVGDEAHHLMDAMEPAAIARVQRAWGKG